MISLEKIIQPLFRSSRDFLFHRNIRDRKAHSYSIISPLGFIRIFRFVRILKLFKITKENSRKKVSGECTRTNRRPDSKETRQFWSKIWTRKYHYRTSEWINDMKKELKELEDNFEANILMESPRATLKKIPN